MASKRKSLSVVEFLEDVCADDEPTQSQDYTFDEVLKISVASFRVLSGEFEDYGRFREAAKRSLTACYEQHRKGAKPQEQILNSSVPVRPMIQRCVFGLSLFGDECQRAEKPETLGLCILSETCRKSCFAISRTLFLQPDPITALNPVSPTRLFSETKTGFYGIFQS